MLAWHTVPKSIKKADFIAFLLKIKNSVGAKPVYLYLDNLRLHYNIEVKRVASEANISIIYAPTYSSQYNPVEICWLLLKRIFRKLLVTETSDLAKFSNVENLVRLSIEQSDERVIQRHVQKCLSVVQTTHEPFENSFKTGLEASTRSATKIRLN
jgi:transposase